MQVACVLQGAPHPQRPGLAVSENANPGQFGAVFRAHDL